jgi:hypothetical protein
MGMTRLCWAHAPFLADATQAKWTISLHVATHTESPSPTTPAMGHKQRLYILVGCTSAPCPHSESICSRNKKRRVEGYGRNFDCARMEPQGHPKLSVHFDEMQMLEEQEMFLQGRASPAAKVIRRAPNKPSSHSTSTSQSQQAPLTSDRVMKESTNEEIMPVRQRRDYLESIGEIYFVDFCFLVFFFSLFKPIADSNRRGYEHEHEHEHILSSHDWIVGSLPENPSIGLKLPHLLLSWSLQSQKSSPHLPAHSRLAIKLPSLPFP